MAFSESFEIGNSLLNKLESQVRRAIGGKQPEKKVCSDVHDKDIVQESPKEEKSSTRSRILVGNASTTNRSRRLRKSKSDSTLRVAPQLGQADDNYSEFFRTEFTFAAAEKSKKESTTGTASVLRVSQIEALIVDHAEEETEPALEVPIFSEDVQKMLEDDKEEELSDNSLALSLSCTKFTEQAGAEVEQPALLDESRFTCPDSKVEAREKFLEELQKSVRAFKETFVLEERISEQLNRTNIDRCIVRGAKIERQQSQIVHKTQTLSNNLEKLKSITAWNLPQSVIQEYKKKGVVTMFDWQAECLSNAKVLFEHSNLVYSAPTSAGKTLVSEILLLKTVIERGKKVLFILPFISVVREKMFYLQDLLTAAGYRVEGFFGGYTPPGGFDSINVAICTIEKANSIVNKLLEQGKLNEIGTVVVDEIHLISDPGRGYILELLLAKIMYMSRKYTLQIQVITMSATLANVELLKRWLDAELFLTDFRPVALQEMIKIGNKVYDNAMHPLRDVNQLKDENNEPFPALVKDGDHVAQLCIETLVEGCSVIVFCPSKDWCENLAMQLAGAIHALGKSGNPWGVRLRAQLNRAAIDEVKKQLREIPTGLDSVLEKTITFACAFHHAGLTTEERDIVEASFKSGALKIIVATSTLSSGVNLPARRVIIRSPLFGGKQMSSLTYRQMIGRAGRTGKDTLGESILICTESNARIGRDLVTAELRPISSCLELDSSTHLKRALLEVISSGVACTKDDLNSFVNCTLLNTQKQLTAHDHEENDEDEAYISEVLKFLIEFEFVRLQTNAETNEENYVATRLGLACLASSMPPTDGLILFAELQKSRRCFVLESELHAVYLVTPYSVCYQMQDLDWLLFLDLWEKLTPAMKKVGELVGVKESFLVRAMRGQTKLDYKLMQIHKRFYTALALQELVNETPINVVASKYKCTRGMLQGLQQMASTFAGIVTAFCNSLQWSTLSLIVSQFKERLYFGIHSDLIELMRLPDLSHKRARTLFDAGITSLVELANADAFTVEKVLYNAISFDSAKQYDNEDAFDAEKRKDVRNFFITGKAGMTVGEAAKLLVQEARQYVQYEIGVGSIQWTQHKQSQEELHMSCEEEKGGDSNEGQQNLGAINKKRKSIEEPPEKLDTTSPPKVFKAQENERLETNPAASGKQIVDNITDRKEEKRKEVTVQKQADLKQNPAKDHFDRKLLSIEKESSTEPQKTQPLRNGLLIAEIDSKDRNVPKASSGLEKLSKEPTQVEPSNGLKRDKAVVQKLTKIPSLEQLPSTSVRSALLQKQASKVRKISAPWELNPFKVETRPLTPVQPKTPKARYELRRSKENGKLDSPPASKENTKPKPASLKTPQPPSGDKANIMPRRSPRNLHANAKGTTIKPQTIANDKVKSAKPATPETDMNDIFMADDSFELNTGLADALNAAVKDEVAFKKPSEIKQENDEIACSQEASYVVPSTPQPSGRSTQASRLLRSYRHRCPSNPSPRDQQPPQVEGKTPTDNSNQNSLSAKRLESSRGSNLELSDLCIENSLMKDPMKLNASHILSCSKTDTDPSSFECIKIIDICGNLELFKAAFKELMSAKRVGCCVGVQQLTNKKKPLIGGNLLINQVSSAGDKAAEVCFQVDDANYVAGLAFSIAENVVFFMNLQGEGSAREVTTALKSRYLRMLFRSAEKTLLINETKEQLKTLLTALPELKEISVSLQDPRVANWLLQPDKILNFQELTHQFAPECTGLVKLCGSSSGCNSFGLNANSAILARVRCSIEACATVHLLKGQIENLERIGTGQLYKFFNDIEMPLQLSLCHMEMLGYPANEAALGDLFKKMVETMKKLETKIYELHGSRFNLSSSAAVAKVVGLHRKTNGRVSTSKQILEKIDSHISQMIITYRKLGVTVAKSVQPLLKCVKNNRIHGQSITLTSTGRIAMSEPNLQNVAKDFTVELGGAEKLNISCRKAFFPTNKDYCLISSDFCQLEMRILAHLSQDPTLLQVMHSEKDVFVAVAARWNKIAEEDVSEELRNGTKQICYGIVYGMGMRALAESLKCTEQEAALVSEQFHKAYPGIRVYIDKVIKFARNNGYVETITGRRRYLEHINSDSASTKSQAARQAVNSTIQGSAADIAKSAILRMEKNIVKYREKLGLGEGSVRFVMHLHDELIFEVPLEKAKRVAKVLSLTMENCVKLSVPLKVKLKVGPSWGELKEMKLCLKN